MAAVLKLSAGLAPSPSVCPETRALINRLRFHASYCRASAHLDIYKACALIAPSPNEDITARTLIRVLGQALDRKPHWHRPGDDSFSFDELWLAQVIEARRDDDEDSFTFLTLRRISQAKRRIFAVLVTALIQAIF